jgi:hypothetical protein
MKKGTSLPAGRLHVSLQLFLLDDLKQNLKNWDKMSIIIKELDFFEGFVISLGAGPVDLTRWQRLMERKISLSGWKAKKSRNS